MKIAQSQQLHVRTLCCSQLAACTIYQQMSQGVATYWPDYFMLRANTPSCLAAVQARFVASAVSSLELSGKNYH